MKRLKAMTSDKYEEDLYLSPEEAHGTRISCSQESDLAMVTLVMFETSILVLSSKFDILTYLVDARPLIFKHPSEKFVAKIAPSIELRSCGQPQKISESSCAHVYLRCLRIKA